MKLRVPLLLFCGFALAATAQTTPSAAPDTSHAQTAEMSMHHDEKAPAVPSTSLQVQTPAQTLTLALADLQAMPQTTIHVHNAHTEKDETYAGPRLADVLAKAGLSVTPKTEHDFLRLYVIAGGTDNYFVLYSGAEVEPALHKAEVIVAISQDGQPLNRTGAFQLIDSLDVKPARWVRNLNKLTVTQLAATGGAH